MTQKAKGQANGRGRPVSREPAKRIPDTPENIAKEILFTPPKKERDWKYLKTA